MARMPPRRFQIDEPVGQRLLLDIEQGFHAVHATLVLRILVLEPRNVGLDEAVGGVEEVAQSEEHLRAQTDGEVDLDVAGIGRARIEKLEAVRAGLVVRRDAIAGEGRRAGDTVDIGARHARAVAGDVERIARGVVARAPGESEQRHPRVRA